MIESGDIFVETQIHIKTRRKNLHVKSRRHFHYTLVPTRIGATHLFDSSMFLENSKNIDVLISVNVFSPPEHCLLLADDNLLLSRQIFKGENEPGILYVEQ